MIALPPYFGSTQFFILIHGFIAVLSTTATIAGSAATFISLATRREVERKTIQIETHLNGRLDQLMKSFAQEAYERGIAEGRLQVVAGAGGENPSPSA